MVSYNRLTVQKMKKKMICVIEFYGDMGIFYYGG